MVANMDADTIRDQDLLREIDELRGADAERRKNLETLKRLHEITASPGEDGADPVDGIIQLGIETFGLPMGVIGRIDGDDYVVDRILGPEGAPPAGTIFRMQDTFCHHALEADGPIGIHHVGESHLSGQPCHRELGFEAYLGTPIYVDGKQFGTLCFASPTRREEPFNQSELSLLQLFASWIGGEFDRSSTLETLRGHLAALTQLHRITADQLAAPAENIRQIIDLGRDLFEMDMGIVGNVVENTYIFAHIYGPDGSPPAGTRLPMGDTYCQFAFNANGSVCIHNVQESDLAEEPCYEKLGLEAYIGTPVYVNGERYGTLCFASAEARPAPFSDSERSLIQLFASWVGGEILRGGTQAEMRESEQKYRAVTENAADAIFVTDTQGRFVEVNEAACNALGYTRDELLEKSIPDIQVGMPRSEMFAFMNNLKSGHASTTEGHHRRRDGSTLAVEIRASMIDWGGEPHALAIARDVTTRKQAENALSEAKDAAEKANIAKSRFLASASHDLCQPLQALNLFVAVLKKSQDEAKREEALAKLESSVGVLGDLLNALLDVSKLEADLVVPHQTTVSIRDLFDFGDEFATLAAARGVGFKILPSDLVIESDPDLLKSILRNLISNAIRYTKNGKILIGCRRRGDILRIEVHDTGIGIEPDKLRLVFEEFYQVENAARQHEEGLGLGLSIVERTARLLNHNVDVYSKPDIGSVFSVEVPLSTEDSAARIIEPAPDELSSGLLVAVIDDDAAVLSGLELLLEGFGCNVVTSDYSREPAIEDSELVEACRKSPDFILADYRLPGGETGITVIERLRESFNAPIPAILLTGEISKDFLVESRRHNIQILHKPVSAEQLQVVIDDITGTNPHTADPEATNVVPLHGIQRR